MKNLSVEELAQELETSNHEKLIKALFLFEKNSSMEDLNSDQIEIILDEVYEFYINHKSISSFLQEDINQALDEAIDKELCKKQEKSFER
ncbi:hypothetical protein KX992_000931 [Campylobacter jejuni]|uniref:Uncharacterized protein n=1 Tax=Campylobacter jejuni TaxID=197 RepID=A0A7D5ELM3_CAMJU|nr:hypothetical protein [Campylobacter jejuni]EFT6718012.1 hypothetical protein [Campylobacter coli]EHY1327784.1 hypothetical protein [Campylobacter lari]EKO7624531.1 hypothetical protein [Campylobacter upsaliensis]ELH4556442.1 hypothetical protein [Campylobacter fetus]MBZ8184925.1 hypothetical protein [Campylobacter jejuni subsp. jejuni]